MANVFEEMRQFQREKNLKANFFFRGENTATFCSDAAISCVMQIPVQCVSGKCNAAPRGAGHPQSRCRGKTRTVPQAEARQARLVALPAAERSLHGDCPPWAGQERQRAALGRGSLTGPGTGGEGRVLPLVNGVDALRDPTLPHELVIFIRVHNILPCKAVLFSTPTAKWLVMELKLLVINPPKDTVFSDNEGLSVEQRSRQG